MKRQNTINDAESEAKSERTAGEEIVARNRNSIRWPAVITIIMLVLAALIAFLLTQQRSERTEERIARTGTIRIGYAAEPPFAYQDELGAVTGESPEVARAVWRRIGVERIEWIRSDFGSLIAHLRSGRIDQIASGMFIRPDRELLVRFTLPSVCLKPALLVKKGNLLKLHSLQDVAGRVDAKLAVLAGAVENDDALRAGIPKDRIIGYPHPSVALESLRNGIVEGLALSAPSIGRLAADNPDMEKASPFYSEASQIGYAAFAFRLEDKNLRDRFNQALREFIGSDAHLRLIRPFGFSEEDLPAFSVLSNEE